MKMPRCSTLPVRPSSFVRPWLGGVVAALAVLGAAAPQARAGRWMVDRYAYYGKFESHDYIVAGPYLADHTISTRREDSTAPVPAEETDTVMNPEGRGIFHAGSHWSAGQRGVAGPEDSIADPPGGPTCANYSVHAVLVWERNQIVDPAYVPPDPEEGWEEPPLIDDPADNPPPFVWIYENAVIQTGRQNTHKSDDEFPRYGPEDPYDGQDITVDKQEIRFGTPGGHYSGIEHLQIIGPGITVTDRNTGFNLSRINTKGLDIVPVPAVTIDAQLTAADVSYANGRLLSASTQTSYEVYPVSIQIYAHRKGTGTNGQPIIAAGGKDSDEHLAEVCALIHHAWFYDPVYGQYGVSGIPREDLPKVAIVDPTGEGEMVSAGLQDDTNPAPESKVTDWEGRVVLKLLKSSDKTTGDRLEGPVQAELQVGPPGSVYNPQTSIHQVWDGYGDWRSGENDSPNMPTTFQYDEPIKLTFRPRLSDGTGVSGAGVPITGHNMRFLAEQVNVTIYNPFLDIFTIKTAEDLGGPDDGGRTEGWVNFSPSTAADSGSGVYSSTLTVPYRPLKAVHWFTPAAEDQNAYHGSEATP